MKWDMIGQALSGEYQGTEQGKFGLIGKVLTEGGIVRFPVRTQLERVLAEVALGQVIRIEYRGEQKSKNGRTFKSYNVAVQEFEDDESEGDVPFDLPPEPEDGHPMDDPGPARTDREGESAMATADNDPF